MEIDFLLIIAIFVLLLFFVLTLGLSNVQKLNSRHSRSSKNQSTDLSGDNNVIEPKSTESVAVLIDNNEESPSEKFLKLPSAEKIQYVKPKLNTQTSSLPKKLKAGDFAVGNVTFFSPHEERGKVAFPLHGQEIYLPGAAVHANRLTGLQKGQKVFCGIGENHKGLFIGSISIHGEYLPHLTFSGHWKDRSEKSKLDDNVNYKFHLNAKDRDHVGAFLEIRNDEENIFYWIVFNEIISNGRAIDIKYRLDDRPFKNESWHPGDTRRAIGFWGAAAKPQIQKLMYAQQLIVSVGTMGFGVRQYEFDLRGIKYIIKGFDERFQISVRKPK